MSVSSLPVGPLLISLIFPVWLFRNELASVVTYVCSRLSMPGNYLFKQQAALLLRAHVSCVCFERHPVQWKIMSDIMHQWNRLGQMLLEECPWQLLLLCGFDFETFIKPYIIKHWYSVPLDQYNNSYWTSWKVLPCLQHLQIIAVTSNQVGKAGYSLMQKHSFIHYPTT